MRARPRVRLSVATGGRTSKKSCLRARSKAIIPLGPALDSRVYRSFRPSLWASQDHGSGIARGNEESS